MREHSTTLIACRFVIAIIVVISLLVFGISELRGDRDVKSLWELGFGSVHANSLIVGWDLPSTGASGLVASVLIGNLPQPILSFLYLLFNGLCTCMLLAKEWGGYRTERKPLRVSDPRGQQRSTYFLQLPYKYAIPLVVMSGVLHWLVSQSLFLANVKVVDRNGTILEDDGVTTCGYSPMAIIFTLVVASLLLISGIGLGFKRLNSDMPVAASCSAAIASACHTLPSDTADSTKPVQWGVVGVGWEGPDVVGHCCFSSEKVTAPVEGMMYAGLEKKGAGGISSGVEM